MSGTAGKPGHEFRPGIQTKDKLRPSMKKIVG